MVSTTFDETDRKWMQRALELAEKGAGYVSPNPMVGCVIVSADNRLLGEGYHERYGENHAEINALESVKDRSNLIDATVYVTLEPCTHEGQTPPCAEKLGDFPFKRVVVAMKDPNPEVDGKGIQYLEEQNIQVDVGLMEEEAQELNEFFLHHITYLEPFVTLKVAQTADGYIAAPDGDARWITGEAARERVHEWRSVYDAVMVGRNTAMIDNPRLTVRHVEGRQPRRIVIDGNYELSDELNLFSDQYENKTIVITHSEDKLGGEDDPMLNILTSDYFRGETISVPSYEGHSDLKKALKELYNRGITSVLVEGGQALSRALLRRNLVDKLELFIAPKLLGGGTRSIVDLDIEHVDEALRLYDAKWSPIGDDMLLSAYL